MSTERRGAALLLQSPDAPAMARNLTAKYGAAALAFARDRAARALAVGDEFAVEAWQAVIEATQSLLRRGAGPA